MTQLSFSAFYYPKVLVALGSNATSSDSTRQSAILGGLAALRRPELRNLRISRIYHTPCVPEGAGPDYLNAAVSFTTHLSPGATLALLHGIERRFGRVRRQRWAARTLDLDLLAWELPTGGLVRPNRPTHAFWRGLAPALQPQRAPKRMILPHPRLQDRAFVLVPLSDIAPQWRHPVLKRSVRQMLAALPAADLAAIRPI